MHSRATLPNAPLLQSPTVNRELKRISSARGKNAQRSMSYQPPAATSFSLSPLSRRKVQKLADVVQPVQLSPSLSPSFSVERKSVRATTPVTPTEFVPPDGSFNVRKLKERPNTRSLEVLLKDLELAHEVKSIYQNDALMAGSAHDLESVASDMIKYMKYDRDEVFSVNDDSFAA